MANNWLKAEQIASQGLALLQRELVVPRFMWNATDYFSARRPGRLNDTVNLPIPARPVTAREYEWRTRTNPIVVDEVEETTTPIKLDRHGYTAFALTDEEMTLDVVTFGEQVTEPRVRGIAEQNEGWATAALRAAPWEKTLAWDLSKGAYPFTLKLRRAFNDAFLPKTDRIVLIGSGVEEAVLADEHLHRVDQSGDDSAFRDAVIGRIGGFTFAQVDSLEAGEVFAFHRSAMARVNLAPTVPDGVPYGAVRTAYGMSMRFIRDYDTNFLRDRGVFSHFGGYSSVNDAVGTDGELNGKNGRGFKVTTTNVPAAGTTPST